MHPLFSCASCEAYCPLAAYLSWDRISIVFCTVWFSGETSQKAHFTLYEAWHSHTLRCHAFSIVASLLCAACGLGATSSLLSFEESRLQTTLSAFFSFSSYSYWNFVSLLFSAATRCFGCWNLFGSLVFSSYAPLRLHTGPVSEVFALDRSGSGRALFSECLYFALRSSRMPLSRFGLRWDRTADYIPSQGSLLGLRSVLLEQS